MRESYPEFDQKKIILELLKIFDPAIAWSKENEGKTIREYIEGSEKISEEQMLKILYAKSEKHYNDRYKTLVKSHPLGIQVNLESGVATGVLVVRDIDSCARLIRSHVLKVVEYDIFDVNENGVEYTYLQEKLSDCIYRVITGDPVLTNSFWNFYLNETNE
jgi:hypothetical protein